MALDYFTYDRFVDLQAASIQANNPRLMDFSEGSLLLCWVEATTHIGIELQTQIAQVLSVARLATSTGTDCDSFCADFGFSRPQAVFASGNVTFSRNSTFTAGTIPVSTIVKTSDGLLSFQVVPDTSNPNYQSLTSVYVIAAGATTCNALVTALTSGSIGNINPNTITLIAGSTPGVDSVTNNVAFINGYDQMADADFIAMFPNYLASLRRGTNAAIEYALSTLGPNVRYAIAEQVDASGASLRGNFVVTADDGSGYPNSAFIAQAAAAVESMRGCGCSYQVIPPGVIPVTIAGTVLISGNYDANVILTDIAYLYQYYVNQLNIGGLLPIAVIPRFAFDASAGVINITNVTVNNATTDIQASSGQVILLASVNLVAVNSSGSILASINYTGSVAQQAQSAVGYSFVTQQDGSVIVVDSNYLQG